VSLAKRTLDDRTHHNISCYFKVTNYGKIPARIVEVGGTFTTIGDMKDLPTIPEYGRASFYNSRPLAVNMESSNIVIQYGENKFKSSEGSEQKGICMGFGFVKYVGSSLDGEDAKSEREPYTTKFSYCFYTHTPASPCGPPGYNDHT
jgi:hypothetical protein